MTSVAVLLPVYYGDNPPFLKDAIDSVLNQSFRDFTLILLIDGPLPNDLLGIIESYRKETRVEIIASKENGGLAAILNIGIKYCLEKRFMYIARMDADDICHSDRILKQLAFLDEHRDTLILGSNATIINFDGNIIGEKIVKERAGFKDILKTCEAIHPAMIFRTEFFHLVGFYDESLSKSQDFELWLRYTKQNGIIYNLQEKLLFFRYEKDLVKRRKKEQLINIKLRIKYTSLPVALCYSIKNIIVLLTPSVFLKWYLNIK